MSDPLKIAVAGLGTVGAATVRLLQEQADIVSARCGRPVVVTAVSARSKGKDRGFDASAMTWYDDPVVMAREADAQVVCELIGGAEGTAKDVVEAALAAGRHVVTANKALLAHHGLALAAQAESNGLVLAYEAAVAGGIPIIKALREGLAGNRMTSICGILNGTCNYILTTMRETGRDFADVLADAQKLGYAEADPSFDVDGVDAAHKLAILASLAFGRKVSFDKMYVEGIRKVSATDFQYANELGYRIKLLCIARQTADGRIEQRVHPCMVKVSAPIATVDGVFNAVVAEGDYVGRSVYEGRGAGAGPTASAVVSDIFDIACGRRAFTFGVPVAQLQDFPDWSMDQHNGSYYVRLMVVDRPGVFADIAAALKKAEVSMDSILQRARAPGEVVPLVMTLHETCEEALRKALAEIESLETVVEAPHVIRIESF